MMFRPETLITYILAVITSVNAEQTCTSNIGFKVDSVDQNLHVNSLNFTNCYKTDLLRGIDGCGAAKGKISSIVTKFQLRKHYEKLTLTVKACPESIKPTCIPYPVSTAFPCDNPEKSMLDCPLNENQDHVYSILVEIGITGVLAMVIPEGETLEAKLVLSGTDYFTREEKVVGTIHGIKMAVLNENDENVIKNQVKTRGLPVCNDQKTLLENKISDESSKRITFEKYQLDQDDSDYGVLHFNVKEKWNRRSFGSPVLEMKINGRSVIIPDDLKYPCGEDETGKKKQTCEFSSLDETVFNENGGDSGQSVRGYKIRFHRNVPSLPKNLGDDSIVSLKFQGENRRAWAEVSMPLSVYITGDEKSEVIKIIGESQPSFKHHKSEKSSQQVDKSRKERWTYSIKQYQNHITQQYKTSASTGIYSSVLVIFIVQFFTL